MVMILLKIYCIYKEKNSGFSDTSVYSHRERESKREISQERRKRERKNLGKKGIFLKYLNF